MAQQWTPTPEEIAEACLEIQRNWTPLARLQHELKRHKGTREWTLPGSERAPLDVLPGWWYPVQNRDDD